MKRIDLEKMLISNGMDIDRKELLGMEFIKLIDGNYLIKNSNGRIVSNEERLKLEKGELIIKDVSSNNCQKETKKKIEEIDKELEEIKNEDIKKAKPIKK